MVDQVIVVVVVGCMVEFHSLLMKMLLLLLCSHHFLLSPEFHDFPVRIGVFCQHECRACSWSILRYEAAGFVPNPTSVTQGFRTKWTGSPLRCFVGGAMETFPTFPIAGGQRVVGGFFLLGWFLSRERDDNVGFGRGICRGEYGYSGIPYTCPRPLATSGFRRYRHVGVETGGVSGLKFSGFCGGGVVVGPGIHP